MAVDIINATADFSDGIPEFTFEDYRRVRMLGGVDPKALGFGKMGGFKPVGVRNGGGADETTYSGGSGGSSSGSSSRSASGQTTWSDRGLYMADDSWDSQHLRVLDKAFDQINKNIDIVQDYFQELFFSEDVSQSGVCVDSLLTGGSLGRRLHITRAELAGGANGRTFPGSPYIKLDENYVRAVPNTWEAQLFCGSGTGTCNCVVSDLSALIIHETTHSCLSGERMAYLIAQWWRGCGSATARHGGRAADI